MFRFVYDSSGNVVSAAVGAGPPLGITSQPKSVTVKKGSFATFSVVVSNASGVRFQWARDGIPIPGEDGDSLLISDVSAIDEAAYTVTVSDSLGSVLSAAATLRVSERPAPGDPIGPNLVALNHGRGSVRIMPFKIQYDVDESVMLLAEPFPESVFVGWSGDLTGDANPGRVTMDRSRRIRGRFATVAPIPPRAIAFWRAETDARDVIGGHHGGFFVEEVMTVPRIAAIGKVGGAFDFDGNAYVRIPDSSDLRPEEITVEAWVMPLATSAGPQTIIARGRHDGSWNLRLSDGVPQCWSHGGQAVSGKAPLPLNEWSHLAISVGVGNRLLYVNGIVVATGGTLGPLTYGAASIPVTIGSGWSGNGAVAMFHGLIDEVSLYRRTLTTEEIAAIYEADRLGKDVFRPYFTSSAEPPDAVTDVEYEHQCTIIFGVPPIRFSLGEGRLPPGLTFSASGLLGGIPTSPGRYYLTVLATDATGVSNEAVCVLRVR